MSQERDATEEPRKVCGAKLRGKDRHCRQWALKDRERCRLHGGLTPRGDDSPHFRTGDGANGEARKHVRNLRKLYDAAKGDPELMFFRHDVALYEALRRQVTTRLAPETPVSEDDRKALLDLGEHIRRLKDSEYRRQATLNTMVPVEQHRRAQVQTAAIVFEVVDRRTRDVIAAIREGRNPDDLVKMLTAVDWTQEMARLYRIAALSVPAIMDVADGGGSDV